MSLLRCATCAHWRPQPSWEERNTTGYYPHCVKLNVREGWGNLKYMPCEPDDLACHEFEDKADEAA